MNIITVLTLGIAFLFGVSFLYLNSSEASVGFKSQPAPLLNKATKQFPTPTPESSETPITIETEPWRDQGNPPNDEISSVDVLDMLVGSKDIDCDGIPNGDDNCFLIYNPNQKDKNKNGVGNACEGKPEGKKDFRCDNDKDGILDRNDNCILVCNPDQKDKNKNGIGDVCDHELLKEWVRIDPCPERTHKK